MRPEARHRAIVIESSGSGRESVYYHCPGCQDVHSVPFSRGTDKIPQLWLFDGNLDYPTLSPSVKHIGQGGESRCHYHVRGGVIDFCSDCAGHGMGGQRVELLRLPQWPISALEMYVGGEAAADIIDGSIPKGMKRVVEWLDQCVFDDSNTCTRCGTHIEEPLGHGGFMMCKSGRKHTVGWSFFCPGCDLYHCFRVEKSHRPELYSNRPEPTWEFDGNAERPTFSPSYLVTGDGSTHHRCHLFLRAGVIEYLDDCTHPRRGTKIALTDIVPGY